MHSIFLYRIVSNDIISFMAHPETLLPMSDIEDPIQRFVSVVKFYLSGWHIKPPYVEFGRYKVAYWRLWLKASAGV